MKRVDSLLPLSTILVFSIVLFLTLSCVSGPEVADTVPPEPASKAVPPSSAETGSQPSEPAQMVEVPPVISPPVEVQPPETKAEELVFDRSTISEETYTTAKTEIQSLIADLNRIIRDRNYRGWVSNLADSYFREISSSAFLGERTEELYRRDQVVAHNLGRDPRQVEKKILRTARDYFDNVVVPSRSNDRLDDIDFVSEKRVKAYTIDIRGNTLVLYDLEVIDGKWKIVN